LGGMAGFRPTKYPTCFLLGGGRSRERYDVDALRDHGILFGCNDDWRTYSVDFLGFQDSPALDGALQFPGPKFVPWREYQEHERAALKKTNGNLFFYWADPWGPPVAHREWPQERDKSRVYTGLTGFQNAQVALILGFTRLVFIGFDCYAPGARCTVSESLENNRWKLHAFREYALTKGVEVVKLGLDGRLNFPAIPYEGAKA
jgi:hypothetical protein